MIFIKDFKKGRFFQAGDQSLICELLHPDREEAALQMGFSLAYAIVKPGQRTLVHKLLTSSEIFFFLEGEAVVHVEQESTPVRPGQVVYVPPNAKQFIQNTGHLDLSFLCLVSPQWKKEDEEIYL